MVRQSAGWSCSEVSFTSEISFRQTWHQKIYRDLPPLVCSWENQFFNINTCKWPSTSSLKSFTWFWWVVNELIPIYFSSHQHAQHMTSQILLILIDFDIFWGTFWSGTRKDIKKQQTAINSNLTDFSCSFKFSDEKNPSHLHFKYINLYYAVGGYNCLYLSDVQNLCCFTELPVCSIKMWEICILWQSQISSNVIINCVYGSCCLTIYGSIDY